MSADLHDTIASIGLGFAQARAVTLPKPTHWHVCACVELPLGWDLEVGYVTGRESVEDAPWVQVVEATLCTPARRVPLQLSDIRRAEGDIEAEIVEALEACEQAEAEERHPSSCRCRDCRDARGDWEYHSRKDDEGPR